MMYELKQVGTNTYYIDCPAKVGIYVLKDNQVCLIDSGSDVSAARKVNQQLKAQNWSVSFIINTHSHSDHIGGNHYFEERYGCAIYAKGQELPFVQWPVMEPTFLFGGAPIAPLRNKFLEAQPSAAKPLEQFTLPDGFALLDLPGHSPEMVGIKTPDDVAFLGDSVASEITIGKYHLTYLHDADQFMQTLDYLETLDCAYYVPAHTEAVTDLRPLIDLNRAKVQEIMQNVLTFCQEEKTFETVLRCIFEHYQLRMDVVQYALIGVTTRAYLSCLHKKGLLAVEIHDNKLFWKAV